MSPEQYAAGYGREEMTRLLLSRGVDVSARNGTGKTAVELVRWVLFVKHLCPDPIWVLSLIAHTRMLL